VWLSLGGLFPSLHKRNDTPVFSVKWAQGDGPPKNSDRIGSQRIHSVSLPSPRLWWSFSTSEGAQPQAPLDRGI
jgi:hypothetical protein